MDFKGKIVFGDPPCLKLRPPLERESLPQKTPVLKSRVLGGLSFSGFLCFSSFSRLFRDLFHNDFGQGGGGGGHFSF